MLSRGYTPQRTNNAIVVQKHKSVAEVAHEYDLAFQDEEDYVDNEERFQIIEVEDVGMEEGSELIIGDDRPNKKTSLYHNRLGTRDKSGVKHTSGEVKDDSPPILVPCLKRYENNAPARSSPRPTDATYDFSLPGFVTQQTESFSKSPTQLMAARKRTPNDDCLMAWMERRLTEE